MKFNLSKTGSLWVYPRLIDAELKILLYTGDADVSVPNTGTIWWISEWIRSHKPRVKAKWSQWLIDRRPAGYMWKLDGMLTYATIAKAGHSAAVTHPSEAY